MKRESATVSPIASSRARHHGRVWRTRQARLSPFMMAERGRGAPEREYGAEREEPAAPGADALQSSR